MQKTLSGLLSKKFYFFNFKFTAGKFLHNLIVHISILKIYANYKVTVLGTNFLKLKFWKFLGNSQTTFNLENVNLLRNPNVNSKHGDAY